MSITLSLSIHKRIIFAGFYLPNKKHSVLKNGQITTEKEISDKRKAGSLEYRRLRGRD